MADGEDRRAARIAPESPNQLVVRDRVNILVLIGGTTDAGNLREDHRSASHSRPGVAQGDPSYWGLRDDQLQERDLTDPDHWYWQDNPDLRATIMEMRAEYTNLRIFPAHGWSGDNSPYNREVAGKYLADRLCGAEGERPYYPALLTREVHFHVLGHSHGGNVLNEFTKEAARVWPARWKIRTVVYLSTPFFRNLHHIDTGAFHGDCKILNVFDEFDLTQRVLADFNLLQLNGALELAGVDDMKTAIGAAASAFGNAANELSDSIMPLLSSIHLEGVSLVPFAFSPSVRLDPVLADRVYAQLFSMLDSLRPVFRAARRVVRRLHQGVEYPASDAFVGRICQGREVISESLVTRWLALIDELKGAIDTTCMQLSRRRQSRSYAIEDVLSDLESPAFLSIARALRVGPGVSGRGGPGNLSSPLTDLLVATLLEQIDVFDNTSRSPADQLAGTRFASNIIDVDVTRHDKLSEFAAEREASRRFLDRLAEIEASYDARRLPDDLVDLLLTLVAHHPGVVAGIEEVWPTLADVRQKLDLARRNMPELLSNLSPGAEPSLLNVIRGVSELFDAAWFWCCQLRDRHIGRLKVEPPIKSPWRNRESDPFVGELAYFARVSHSQSRFALYPEVRSEIEAQLTTRRRRAASSH